MDSKKVKKKIANLEMLRRMEKDIELLSTLKTRKLQDLGHIMRCKKHEILRKIEGKGKNVDRKET